MKHVKVLPMANFLYGHMDEWYYYESCHMKRIDPVFNRNGRYFDRKEGVVWEECDGRAYQEGRIDDFIYELKTLSHKPLSHTERQAIHALIDYRSCPRCLRQLLLDDNDVLSLREVVVSATRFRVKVLERRWAEQPVAN